MKANAVHRLLFFFYLLLSATTVKADDGDVLDRVIYLPQCRETVYRLLGKISDQTGYQFIYDSKLVDNEQIVKFKAGNRTVCQAIYETIGNHRLKLRLTGRHILIFQSDATVAISAKSRQKPDSVRFLTIAGRLYDKYTQEPISYGTVSVSGTSIGSVTNQDGAFRLHLPDSLRHSKIRFSHLGYLPQEIEAVTLAGNGYTLSLEPKVIPIQEIIIRVANPMRLLREMMAAREKNYARHPVYFTSFYREGIEHKNKFVNLNRSGIQNL